MILVAALALTAGTALTPVAAAAATATVQYVALGDSYSAGVGTPDESGSCGRSPSSYPSLWAVNHPAAVLHFAACGGATTDSVRTSQLGDLDAGTTVVSITAGGNDVGFSPTLSVCTAGSDDACRQQVASARAATTSVLPGKLDATYQAIRAKAPNARLVVLGYPRLFNPAVTCPTGGLSTVKQNLLNAAADDLNAVIRTRATAAGATFTDVTTLFTGHEICTAVAWINNVSPARPSDSYHPNGGGYAQAYLPLFTAAAGIGV
ncbi:lysophospholipase L1-like esterase [Actinoplanes tereljensis]|uniref:Lipase 1 n=1 Tax=Paractinoplanes tereljensis TaxID=571912 RepID=A0A919NR50_9ACTN|nr:SGNH/GDSL hydrolase family protein [Actinoplanes tereljensis]GIF23545.1 lipase 1 [Actinoplanes tereljensis]